MGLTLQNNVIHHGGQLGVGSYKASLNLYNNIIHTNNIADYDILWEAGGVKVVAGSNGVWDGNTLYGNDGEALWCDGECESITISNNTLHHNEKGGIFYEISHNGKIHNNILYENGWTYESGSWVAALRTLDCDGCEIYANTVAWNQAGIGILHTEASEQPYARNNYVHDNFIYQTDSPSTQDFNSCDHGLALAYCQVEPDDRNLGSGNKYYYPTAEGSAPRYHYHPSGYSSLASFNATSGEEGGTYLTTAQKDANLSALGVPTSPSR
jgi:parallel beta-helix repeat protein